MKEQVLEALNSTFEMLTPQQMQMHIRKRFGTKLSVAEIRDELSRMIAQKLVKETNFQGTMRYSPGDKK